ncbi:MAG: hypothetical protein HRU82_02730 [Nitrospira sp.]|nr:MAG: hypothetical protein HRU82_02730 [Nitrospira sp.]
MLCHVYLTDDKLAVRAPFALKDALKGVPGARWNKELHVWVYPPTPHAARAVFDAIPSETSTWSDHAAALLVEAERIAKAAELKTAENLPNIPQTKTTPWPHQARAFWFAIDMLGGL